MFPYLPRAVERKRKPVSTEKDMPPERKADIMIAAPPIFRGGGYEDGAQQKVATNGKVRSGTYDQRRARVAGVSKKTVSRVINRSPLLKQATREKVEKVIAELGYTPTRRRGPWRCGATS